MAAILNSAILVSDTLHKKNFTCSFWLKLMMAAILIIFHLRYHHGHLGFKHLVISISDSDSNYTLPPLWLCLKLIPFSLNLMMAVILNSGHLGFSDVSFSSQAHSHLCKELVSNYLQKNWLQTHSFWLNLMMAAILNSAMLDFRHCHFGFRHLVIFSQIHSKTLSLHSDSDSN